MLTREDFMEDAIEMCHANVSGVIDENKMIDFLCDHLFFTYMKGYNAGLTDSNEKMEALNKRIDSETTSD